MRMVKLLIFNKMRRCVWDLARARTRVKIKKLFHKKLSRVRRNTLRTLRTYALAGKTWVYSEIALRIMLRTLRISKRRMYVCLSI